MKELPNREWASDDKLTKRQAFGARLEEIKAMFDAGTQLGNFAAK